MNLEDTQPLSFGRAWHPADTVLPDRVAVFGTDELRAIGSRAAREGDMRDRVRLVTDPAYTPPARIDAVGHTVCDLTRDDLHSLLVLVRLDRARLLSERRAYVKARGADHTRFTELLRSLTAQIDTLNKLADKLARLHMVTP